MTRFATFVLALASALAAGPGGDEPIEPRPVFVPRADFATAVERSGSGLTMPYRDLRALARAAAESRFHELVPSLVTGAALGSLAAEARVADSGELAIEVTATATVLRPGIAALVLGAKGLALVSAETADGGEPVAADSGLEGEAAIVFLRGMGEHALRLSYTAPIRAAASGRAGVRFALPRAARATLRLAVPGGRSLAARSGVVPAGGVAGESASFALDGGEIAFDWIPRDAALARPFVEADVALSLRATPDLATGTATCRIRSTAPLGETVRVRWPADLSLTETSGPSVAAFEAAPGLGGDGTTVDVAVRLADPLATEATFSTRFERIAATRGEIVVPCPEFPDAARSSAVARVASDPIHAVAVRRSEGARRVALDPNDRDEREAFAADALPFSLVLGVADAPDAAAAETSAALDVEPGFARLTIGLLRIAAGTRPIAEAAGSVPEGFGVESAALAGAAGAVHAEVVPGAAGAARLVLRFDPPLSPGSAASAVIRLVRPERSLPETIVLEPFRLDGFPPADSTLRLAASSRRAVVDRPGAALVKAAGSPGDAAALDWIAPREGGDVRLAVEIAEPEPRVEATLVAIAAPYEEKIVITAGARFDVTRGAADRFRVDLPAGTTEHLDVTPLGGLRLKESFKSAEDGRDVWTFAVSERREGPVDCVLRFEIERKPLERAAPTAVPLPRARDVARERLFVAVESSPEIDVSPEAKGLEALDLASLPSVASVRPGRPLLHAYASTGRDASLSLAIRARAGLPVPAIAAASALAECAVDESGVERTRLFLRVRNAGAQRLRLALSDDSRLLTATVGGRAVKPLAGESGGILLVPVPVTPGDGESVDVEVIAERRGRPLRSTGSIEIVLPGTDAVVLESELRLYLPAGHHPVSIGGTYSGGRLLGEGDRPLVVDVGFALLGLSSGVVFRESDTAPAVGAVADFAEETAARAESEMPAEKDATEARRRQFEGGYASAAPQGKKGLLPIALAFAAAGRAENFSGLGLGRVEVRLLSERADRGFIVASAAIGFLLPFALRRRGFGGFAAALVVLGLASGLPALLPALATRYLNGLAGGALAAMAALLLLAVGRRVARLARRRRTAFSSALLVVVASLSATAAAAGDEEGTPPRPPLPPRFEDAFFVPYDPATMPQRSGPLLGDDDSVFVPRALYLRLWIRAHPEGSLAGDAPQRNALVSRASIEADVAAAEARIAARFAVAVLEERFEDVVFPFAGATIESATLDGRPAALRALPEAGGFALAIGTPGVHDVEIRFALPLGAGNDGVRLLALDLPPCPATRAVLSLASGLAVVSANVPPGRLVESRAADGRSTARLDLGAARRLEAVLRDVRAPGEGGPVFEAAVATHYTIRPGRAEIATEADVTVLKGAVRDLEIRLDPSIRVRNVEAPGLRDREVAESGEGTTLSLRFEPPLTGVRRIRLRGVAAIDTGAGGFALPLVRVLLAERETAFATLFAENAWRLGLVDGAALDQVAPADVRPSVPKERPVDLAYRFRRADAEAAAARFTARPAELRLEADFLEQVTFSRGRIGVAAEWTLRAAGEPAFEAVIEAPSNVETIAVESRPPGLVASWHEETEGGTKRVRLRFAAALPRECVLAARFSGAATVATEVPFVRLAGVESPRGRLVASADSSLRLVEESAAGLLSAVAPDGARLAWSIADPARAALTLRVEPEPARLSAASFTALEIGEERIEARATVLFRVEEGESDLFRIGVEGEADGPIDVAVDGRRRVSVVPAAGGAGSAIEVETRAPRRGEVRIDVRFDVPRAADGVYRLPVVRARETREAAAALGAFVTAARGEIRPRPEGGVLAVAAETASRRLPGVDFPRDAAVFEIPEGASFAAEHVAFTVEETLEASISELSLTTRLADADASGRGVLLTRARFTIQNRREQFLALRLPEGAALIGATVDDAAVRPVSGAPEDPSGLLLPLRKSSPGDTSYTAEIVFSESRERPLTRLGPFRPGAPEVRNMAVQRTYWKIVSDEGFTLSADGDMTEIPEAVELAERADRILSEQKILLGYLGSKSESLRARALANFGKNQVLLEDTLRFAQEKQEQLEFAAKEGRLEPEQLVLSIDNATNIRKTLSQTEELGRQVLMAQAPSADPAATPAPEGEPEPRGDFGARRAGLGKPGGPPAARDDEAAEAAKEKRARKANEPAGGELDEQTVAELELLGYAAGGEENKKRSLDQLAALKSTFEPRGRSGLKTIAVPFPESGRSRTWKKLEGSPALEIELLRTKTARPVLAAAAVLAGALLLLAARRHWRGKHPDPNLAA